MFAGCTKGLFPFGDDKYHVSHSICAISCKTLVRSQHFSDLLASLIVIRYSCVMAIYFADTMMKFASFETIVEMMYKYVIPTPKEQCSKSLQLGVSFAGGYVAGVFCAVVSHPADNLVSFLNNAKGASVGDVSLFYSLSIEFIF